MNRASTTSIGGQWPIARSARAPGGQKHHARWRFKGLSSVEHAFLYLGVFLAAFTPLRIPGVLFTASDICYCICFGILLLSGRLPATPLGKATSLWYVSFFLFMFGMLGSSLVNGSPIRGFIVVGQYFFAYVLLLYVFARDDPKLIHRLAAIFVVSILIIDIHGIFEFYTAGYTGARHGAVTGGGRLATMLGNANLASTVNALTLPLLLYLWHAGTFKNLMGAIGLSIIVVTTILTSSNSGLITLVFAVFSFAAVVMNTKMILRLAALVIVGATVLYFGGTDLLPQAFQERVLGAVTSGDVTEAGTYDDRLALMEEAKARILQHGFVIFGMGADQFRKYSSLGAPVHVVYLLVWAEGGLIALIGWLMFFAVGLGLGVVARIRRVGAYAGGTLIAILLVFLVSAAFKPHMYARHYLTPVMLALALVISSMRTTSEEPLPLVSGEPVPPPTRKPRPQNGGSAPRGDTPVGRPRRVLS